MLNGKVIWQPFYLKSSMTTVMYYTTFATSKLPKNVVPFFNFICTATMCSSSRSSSCAGPGRPRPTAASSLSPSEVYSKHKRTFLTGSSDSHRTAPIRTAPLAQARTPTPSPRPLSPQNCLSDAKTQCDQKLA